MLWHHFFFLYQCSKINHHYAQPKLYSFSTLAGICPLIAPHHSFVPRQHRKKVIFHRLLPRKRSALKEIQPESESVQ